MLGLLAGTERAPGKVLLEGTGGRFFWVLEGSLAGFVGLFLRSGRPQGPGKAFKKVGGFTPHIF
jgi:hypothetical protein